MGGFPFFTGTYPDETLYLSNLFFDHGDILNNEEGEIDDIGTCNPAARRFIFLS